MPYVDGFVLPVPEKNLAAYKKMATKAGKIWMEHGALEYRECIADDMNAEFAMPFPKAFKLKKGEVVVFSWIVYKNKAQRDRINKKIMNDPRMMEICDPKNMPFECKRMAYGGFKTLVWK